MQKQESQLLAERFDNNVTSDMKSRRKFWQTGVGKILGNLFKGMTSQLESHEAPTRQLWSDTCRNQQPLKVAVYETLRQTEEYSHAQMAYITDVIGRLFESEDMHSIILVAFILYQRFKSTFEGGADISGAAIKQWLKDIQPATFDDRQRRRMVESRDKNGESCKVQDRDEWEDLLFEKKTYELSERERSMLDKLGTCAVFAICVQLASFSLEDLPPAQFEFDIILTDFDRRNAILKEPDEAKKRAMTNEDRHALLIFELAVLDRIGWKTHVSVEQYMESVETLPNLAEDTRQKILDMLEQHAASSV